MMIDASAHLVRATGVSKRARGKQTGAVQIASDVPTRGELALVSSIQEQQCITRAVTFIVAARQA